MRARKFDGSWSFSFDPFGFIAAVAVATLCLVVLACWVFAIIILYVAPDPLFFRVRRRNLAFRQTAEALGGTWIAGSLFRLPEVHFEYRGQPFQLDGDRDGYFKYMRLTALCPPACQALRCEITSFKVIPPWGRMREPDIPAGPPDLQTIFCVRGNDPARIARSLTPSVAETLHELRGLRPQGHLVAGGVSVEIADVQMEIRKGGLVTERPDLEQFIRVGLKLYDAWVASVGAAGPPLTPRR